MTEVVPVGRVGRLLMYVLCTLMILSSPGFPALGHVLGARLWIGVLVGGLLSLILVPIGLAMWSDVRRTALGMRRLDEVGIAGHATVMSVTPTSYDDRTRLALELWIDAPGMGSFEALHTCDDNGLEAGATLGVVVDPAGRFYAVC